MPLFLKKSAFNLQVFVYFDLQILVSVPSGIHTWFLFCVFFEDWYTEVRIQGPCLQWTLNPILTIICDHWTNNVL